MCDIIYTRMTRRLIFKIVTGVLFLTACSDSLYFEAEEPVYGVTIKSVPAGSILAADDGIPVSYTIEEGPSPDVIAARLRNNAGEVVFETSWEDAGDQTDTVSRVDLPPSLPNGIYELVILLDHDGGTIGRYESVFFVLEQELSIDGIVSYPASLYPGATGIFQAAGVRDPEGLDVFYRWSVDGNILREALAANGGGEVEWQVPETVGVYTMVLDVFPFAPDSVMEYPSESAVRATTEVYVTNDEILSPNDFVPAGSYYSLYHFRGDLRDSAPGGKTRSSPEFITGLPDVEFKHGVFGYLIDESYQLEFGKRLFPVTEQGTAPFSFSLRLAVASHETDQQFFHGVIDENKFGLKLFFDEDGVLAASVLTDTSELTAADTGGLFKHNEVQTITVNVVPAGERLLLSLFINESLAAAAEGVYLEPAFESRGGSALLGTSEGFSAIVDELGVYHRDENGDPAVDSGLFKKEAARRFDDVITAEGFDLVSIPVDLVAEGPVTLGPSSMRLGKQSKVLFEDLELDSGLYGIDISYALGADDDFEGPYPGLVFGPQESSVEITINGKIIKSGVTVDRLDVEDGRAALKILVDEDGTVKLLSPKGSTGLGPVKAEGIVPFGITNPGTALFEIHDYVIYRINSLSSAVEAVAGQTS